MAERKEKNYFKAPSSSPQMIRDEKEFKMVIGKYQVQKK